MSATFAKNDLVMYELYNEPHIDSYATWSAGDDTYAGMLEMYEVVRKNVGDNAIVLIRWVREAGRWLFYIKFFA